MRLFLTQSVCEGKVVGLKCLTTEPTQMFLSTSQFTIIFIYDILYTSMANLFFFIHSVTQAQAYIQRGCFCFFAHILRLKLLKSQGYIEKFTCLFFCIFLSNCLFLICLFLFCMSLYSLQGRVGILFIRISIYDMVCMIQCILHNSYALYW